jgi:ferric-dicitrate binding protein FerR (iron transport regulator)
VNVPYLDRPSPAARYASGQMTAQEEQAFEVLMVENPQVAAEVDALHRIRAGLRHLRENGELESLLRRPRPWAHRLAWPAAIALLLIVGAVGLYVHSRHELPTLMAVSPSDLSGAARGTNPHTFLLAHARGGGQPIEITLPDHSQVILLRILPQVPTASRAYRVTLGRISADGTMPIARTLTVQTGDDGLLAVYLDPARLAPGDYRLTIGQPAGSEAFTLHLTFLN